MIKRPTVQIRAIVVVFPCVAGTVEGGQFSSLMVIQLECGMEIGMLVM